MITKNSVERLGVELFGEVLKSSLQIPYKFIIFIDDSTSNETVKIVKIFAQEHGKDIIAMRSNLYGHPHPTRATARQTAIDIFFQIFTKSG